MGKATQRAAANGVDPHVDANVCKSCGWNFAHDNARRIPIDLRQPNGRTITKPRSPIAIRGVVVCDVCYCRGLMQSGKHSAIGTPYANLHRDALFSQASNPAIAPSARTRTAIAETAARFGESADEFQPDDEGKT